MLIVVNQTRAEIVSLTRKLSPPHVLFDYAQATSLKDAPIVLVHPEPNLLIALQQWQEHLHFWTSKCWLKLVPTNKGCWRGEEADHP